MLTADVRAGACIHAQRPRPGGTAAAARARRCGSRSDSGGGCHTWDVKTAASATARKEPARKRAGALADEMPLRQTGGGDRTGQDDGRLPPSACDWHRPASAATRAPWIIFHSTPCGRPVPDSGMACACTRRECEPVAVFVAAVGAATPGMCKRRRAWQPTPQQACAVRMAGDTPSAVMPPRNARR